MMLSSKTKFSQLPQIAYTIAKDKGWWEEKRSKQALVNLVMSEWAEALEGLRMGKICNGRDWDVEVVWEWGEGDFKEESRLPISLKSGSAWMEWDPWPDAVRQSAKLVISSPGQVIRKP